MAQEAIGFFDLNEIEVTVTYPFLKQAEPMRFYLRPILDKEAKASRQAFFGMTAAEQEAAKHEHNVKLLAMLSARLPQNVPTFPEEGEPAEAVATFFAGTNPMKAKLADDVLTLYFGQMQPSEFFRSI